MFSFLVLNFGAYFKKSFEHCDCLGFTFTVFRTLSDFLEFFFPDFLPFPFRFLPPAFFPPFPFLLFLAFCFLLFVLFPFPFWPFLFLCPAFFLFFLAGPFFFPDFFALASLVSLTKFSEGAATFLFSVCSRPATRARAKAPRRNTAFILTGEATRLPM